MPANPVRAVCYYRTSTTKQETSIDEQQQFSASACKREKLTLVREFQDFGIAGDEIARRAGLQAMLSFCEEQQQAGTPIDCLVVWDQDRVSRADSWKAAVIYDRLVEAGTTRVLCQEGWVDLTDELTRVMQNIRQDIGRRGYARSVSKSVARSCLERAKLGMWPGGRRPHGYTLGPDRHLAVDDSVRDKAETVRWLFREYATRDTSQLRLAEELNSRKASPPSYYSEGKRSRAHQRQRREGQWTRWNVNAILKNPIYTGTLYYARTHQGKYHSARGGTVEACKTTRTATGRLKVQRNAEAEQVITPNAHPALVDRETFDLVQRKLEANKPGFRPGTTRRTFDWIFGNGLLRCAKCGSFMYGRISRADRHGKRYEWKHYLCSRYSQGGNKHCGYNCVREDVLLPRVAAGIAERFSDPELIRHIEQRMAAKEKAWRLEVDGQGTVLRRRIGELERWIKDGNGRLAKVPEDLLAGLVGEIRGWKQELEAARQELATVESQEKAGRQKERQVKSVLERLQKLPKLIHKLEPALVREMFRAIIDHIEVHFDSRRVKERSHYWCTHAVCRVSEAAKLFGIEDIELPMSLK